MVKRILVVVVSRRNTLRKGQNMEETIIVNGHMVKIKYARQNNPCTLENLRSLLEKQIIAPKTP